MKLSYSKLKDYHLCPRSFELKHIRNLEEKTENIYSAFGSAIHFAIEEAINKKDPNINIADMIRIFRDDFSKRVEKIPLRERQFILLTEWHIKAEELLTYFYNQYFIFIRNGKIIPIETEKYFSIEVIPGFFFNGFIDFVYKEDEKLKILDWKTGKVQPKNDHAQLDIYAAICTKIGLEDVLEAKYVFLKHKKENAFTLNLEEKNNKLKYLKETCLEIKQKLDENEHPLNDECFLENYGNHCRYCKVSKICELIMNRNSNTIEKL